jgi:hypothetical protein
VETGGREQLEEELGSAVPDGLAGLGDADLQALAVALRDARRRHRAALDEAIEAGLGDVPALLRGAVRKAVGL